MHKGRVFQCARITTENYWTVSINVLLRVCTYICWTYWLSARKSQLRETQTCQVLERGS
jgi:predicted negative regulator of RcsB-dependent stress response